MRMLMTILLLLPIATLMVVLMFSSARVLTPMLMIMLMIMFMQMIVPSFCECLC